MIILGIDPGTCITGFGVIDYHPHHTNVLDFGCIKPPTSFALSKRYLIIHEAIEELIVKHRPDCLSIESQFVLKNVQSAIKLGMAKGMAILAAEKHGLEIFEYAPKEAKLAVTGHGSSSKEQVQKMMQLLLNLPKAPEPEDAADALALALCHANHLKRFKQAKVHA
jgi:crossover junction endodeoxyribonuclease RuvC